jgi:uncharacterized damage-inducible protein DinB
MRPHKNELERFLAQWEHEAGNTQRVLESLPPTQYDYRPDTTGRSLGELAWHLAEIEAYMTHGIETGRFDMGMKPPGIERPREVGPLATGYRRVHDETVERVRRLKPGNLDRKLRFFDGGEKRVGDILWASLLLHQIHHRGQLVLLCRLAGGRPPGTFGPTREDMAALRAQLQKA